MRNIYTGIDIGSDSIKIVVVEFLKDKFHVLASTSVRTQGVKRGLVTDHELVVNSLKLALVEIEKSLGVRIDKAVVAIPSNERALEIVSGTITLENGVVSGDEIIRALQIATNGKIKEKYELVSMIPILFKVDGKGNFQDPKGQIGNELEVKAVLAAAPRKVIYDTLRVVSDCNIEIADIVFSGIGDYYEAMGADTKEELGAVVNIGSETIDISIFNKGILIKNSLINLGSKNIDKDISYVCGVDNNTARELKEKFAVCSRRYADINDVIEVPINDNEKVSINQYEISEIIEARVMELLKLAKKEINDLTKRKISYIIVTGGISELMGFSYVVENMLGMNASTLVITTVGIRSNRYSTAIGIVKYFYDKMKLRGKHISMLSEEKVNELMENKRSMIELSDDTLISRIFGYFTID